MYLSNLNIAYTCKILLLLLLVSGCAKAPEERTFEKEGNVIHISGENYKIIVEPHHSPERKISLDAILEEHIENPFSRIRVPVSIQEQWTFNTKQCGRIKFVETLVGDIWCTNCDEVSHYKNCFTVLRSINNFKDWYIED